MAVADRIFGLLTQTPDLDDDEIAARLGLQRQQVNQVCRSLATQGVIRRSAGPHQKIVNRLAEGATAPTRAQATSVAPLTGGFVTEDEVKAAVKEHLEEQGYTVSVAWGRTRGIDIEAVGPRGRFLIEAKGEVASQPQKTNYFLGALGELLQRMSDERATYGLALPDNGTYRGLLDRLPGLAKRRLNLRVLYVRRSGEGLVVEEELIHPEAGPIPEQPQGSSGRGASMRPPEGLEQELRDSLAFAQGYLDSRNREERELANYRLGKAAGIMAALDELGYGDWKSRFVAELEDEEDGEWAETEGGKAWIAGQRWMGRRVSRMARRRLR